MIKLNKIIYDVTLDQYIKNEVNQSYERQIRKLYETNQLPKKYQNILNNALQNLTETEFRKLTYKTEKIPRRKKVRPTSEDRRKKKRD